MSHYSRFILFSVAFTLLSHNIIIGLAVGVVLTGCFSLGFA
jgi:hypothetical protein